MAVRRGHPWVFREGIVRPPQNLASGTTVELFDDQREPLGKGLWDARSPIACRVYMGVEDEPLDTRRLIETAEKAFHLRDRWFADGATTAYRYCNGEGDRLPGLVIDRYADVAILRIDGEALGAWTPRLASPLFDKLRSRGVKSLARRLSRDEQGKKRIVPLAGSEPPDRIKVREHGMTMIVDLAEGQKTGAFLDQRENRRRVRELCRGQKRVLNLFSYAGGFSLAAALGGAKQVVSVDIAASAHATAQESFRDNGLDPKAHGFVSADVFAYLEAEKKRGGRFDVVVCDPPSFAPNERSKDRALSAYRKLHGAAASALEDGGVLCAASCSSHVTAEDFLATLDDAALGRRDLRLLALYGPPNDHPSLAVFPEGRYLKMAVLG